MPEVGISGLPLDYPFTGSAVYVRNLVRELPLVAPELSYFLFARRSLGEVDVRGARISSPFGPLHRGPAFMGRLDKLVWEVGSLPGASFLRRNALLHSTYFAAPLIAACPIVVTVHDVIPLILPHYHRSRQAQWYARFMAWNVSRTARALITVSEHAKSDLVRVLGVSEQRVHVTYEAVEDRFSPTQARGELERVGEKYHLPPRFVLYIGGAERRKNLEMLVHAWSGAVGLLRDREVKLVMVARFPPPDALFPDVPGLIRSLGLEDDVVLIDHVEEADKPAVYAGALLFCFPSEYEGFGLPPLEAMASGVPVLCSNASSLPEVVGTAACLLPPGDPHAWSDAIVRVADSALERATLSAAGLQRVHHFSWKDTARRTASIYRGLLGA